MNLNKLAEAKRTLAEIRKITVEAYHFNQDKSMRETCLDCLIEINHLGFVIDELIQNENIPFYQNREGAL